ncbi:MAG: alpha/beta hydrolase-fold protein [Gemmatimonadota bacterium]
MPGGISLRSLLWWLAPSAAVGGLSAQTRATGGSLTEITIDTIANLPSRYLETTRTIRVFLPPGYAASGRRYPVLYLNDGQDAEDIGLIKTLDSMYTARAVEPVIVVAAHATNNRIQEYGVSGSPNAQGFGSQADGYEKFLIRELLPLINRRFRTIASPERTAIAGWSLGALSAFDIAWHHPESFGAIGAFSGSFWWRTNDSTPESRQSSRVVHQMVRQTQAVPRVRAWFEAGRKDETDDRDGNGVIDAIQDTRELMLELEKKGFEEEKTMQYVEMKGGHNPETWGEALPAFLRWAFPRK